MSSRQPSRVPRFLWTSWTRDTMHAVFRACVGGVASERPAQAGDAAQWAMPMGVHTRGRAVSSKIRSSFGHDRTGLRVVLLSSACAVLGHTDIGSARVQTGQCLGRRALVI